MEVLLQGAADQDPSPFLEVSSHFAAGGKWGRFSGKNHKNCEARWLHDSILDGFIDHNVAG